MVLVGDQNADLGLTFHLPPHPVGAGEQAVGNFALLAGAGQVVRQGPLGRRGHIGLGVGAPRGGPGVNPPVVQHLGQVGGAPHLFDQAEEQVVVLAAVALRPLAPDLLIQFPAEHRQVTDVVAAEEIVRGIVRLEMGGPGAADVLFKEGLVAVQEPVGLACGPQVQDGPAHLIHGMGGQDVVVVGQSQIFPVRQGGGRIGVLGDALIFDLFIYDLLILRLIFPHNLPYFRVSAVGGVRQAELAIGRRLPHKGIQKGPQVDRRRIVQGGQDADGGQAAVCPGFPLIKGPLGCQNLFVGQIAGLFAEKAALDEARAPFGHGGQAFFPGHRHRIAAQLPDAFALLFVHMFSLVSLDGPRPQAWPRWTAL